VILQRVWGDGGSGPAVPDAQAHDDHGTAHQVQIQTHRRQLRAAGGDYDSDPQADQPGQAEHQRQDVPQHQTYLML
jgi:hypothetical protein